MTRSIAHNIDTIRQNLPESVRLVVVTKQVSVLEMRAAYEAGIRDFGESRIQAAEIKQEQLRDLPDLCWHLIGHLQSNKVRKAVQIFDWIHSVDSIKLAQQIDGITEKIDRETSLELKRKPKLCLQVKILADPDKYGWSRSELLADLPELDRCQNLDIRGLMAIAPLGLSSSETLSCFEQAKDLSHQIDQQGWKNIQMSELSMGMSGDYPQAILAGATTIRLGSIIFGDCLDDKLRQQI